MSESVLALREKYRLEWENNVINYINSGYLKADAKRLADERLEDKYSSEED